MSWEEIGLFLALQMLAIILLWFEIYVWNKKKKRKVHKENPKSLFMGFSGFLSSFGFLQSAMDDEKVTLLRRGGTNLGNSYKTSHQYFSTIVWLALFFFCMAQVGLVINAIEPGWLKNPIDIELAKAAWLVFSGVLYGIFKGMHVDKEKENGDK